MNHREPPHSPAGAHGARLCLSLSLLLTMAPTGVHALTRSHSLAIVSRDVEPTPYLLAVGAPPLRFQEPAVPPAPVPSTPVVATPDPVAAPSEPSAPDVSTPAPTTSPVAVSESAPASETPVTAPPSPANPKTPAAILPDDSRPPIRPEDFLPYFQIPGSARQPADVTLLVPAPPAPPAPGTLPPSSATYIQTPR
jgi:hypothetical protein